MNLGKLTFNKLNWLELATEFEGKRSFISDKLKLNPASTQIFGIGIIRTLIFGENTNGLAYTNPISVFHLHDDGQFEFEKWIGANSKLSKSVLNEELDALLSVFSDKKKLSTGWGFDPKNESIHLLRSEDGEWQNLVNLCVELPEDAAKLFDRKKVCSEHVSLLEESFLSGETSPWGAKKTRRGRNLNQTKYPFRT